MRYAIRSQLSQGIELRDVSGWVDPSGNDHRLIRFNRLCKGIAKPVLCVHYDADCAKALRKLFPIHSTHMNAIGLQPFNFLFHSDETNLLVVKDNNDDRQLLADRSLEFGNGHHEATV